VVSAQQVLEPPAPALPEEVAAKTGEKYRQAYRVITGRDL